MASPVTAVIVPTLGLRSEFLIQCLRSIRNSGNAHICIVSPDLHQVEHFREDGLMDQHVLDKSEGLPAAINNGINCLPGQIEFVNWLGDDDLLKENSLNSMQMFLEENPQVGMVFGRCSYIDEHGNQIWINKSGQWACSILSFGPCLVPQPGALFRRSAFDSTGGLNTNLKWAFDLDLFIRFKKISKVKYLSIDAACFRWHPESLSVGSRKGSVNEASRVRQAHLSRFLRKFSFIWEVPVKRATYVAGLRLSSRKSS
jgi:hypothetical protein